MPTSMTNHCSSMSTTIIISLLVLTLEISFHVVQGTIQCGFPNFAPDNDQNVCFKDTSTFLCDENADACTQKSFSKIQGTTSKCTRKIQSTTNTICQSSTFAFDDADTKAQGMTCDGDKVCRAALVVFGNNAQKGTLTCIGPEACGDARAEFPTDAFDGTVFCRGGTWGKPTCPSLEIYGGCLICEGPYSCYDIYLNDAENNYQIYYEKIFIQGSFGPNCPVEQKTTKPAIPTCFSGKNTVEVQDKGLITMDSLNVGDYVKTGITPDGQPQFSHLISFMHKQPQTELDYLQIFNNITPKIPLEISSDHLLYLSNNKAVRAKDVRIGDVLKSDSTLDAVVTHIHMIQREGLYAPVTENGKIWVSGVTASSYISLLDTNIVSPNKQVLLSHMALAPLRMVCNTGSFSICKNELFSEDGYSMNLLTLVKFGLHFLSFALPLQLLMMMVSAPMLLILAGFELSLNPGILVIALVGGLIIAMSKMKQITK